MGRLLLVCQLFAVGRVFAGRVRVKNRWEDRQNFEKWHTVPCKKNKTKNKTKNNWQMTAATATAMTSKLAVAIAIEIVMAIRLQVN